MNAKGLQAIQQDPDYKELVRRRSSFGIPPLPQHDAFNDALMTAMIQMSCKPDLP